VGQQVIGREIESLALTRFLEQPYGVPDVHILEGDPGIGKTTLLRTALQDAADRGYRVLASQPVQAESQLSFAGLRDLLEGVPHDVMAEIGGPQRRALEVALLLRDPEPQPPDERAISFAFLTVVRILAKSRPVLLAVDDAQWLDPASARTLGFAIRRTATLPLKTICTRGSGVPVDVVGDVPADRLLRLSVAPLDMPALRRVLRERLGLTFRHWISQRIWDASGGNPFFALELGRAMAAFGEPGVESALPIPAEIADLTRLRLGRLAERSRMVLGLAAVLSRPTIDSIRRAVADTTSTDAALAAAVNADLVSIDDQRVRFVHPILREAALTVLSADERRDLHRQAAEVVSTSEEEARHLALSVDGLNEPIAARVEAAARESAARGSGRSAAELAELAAALSPATYDEARRRLAAADHRYASGDVDRARELVADLVEELEPSPARAEALHRLALLTADMVTGTDLCRKALAEAGDDPRLRGVIFLRMARLLGMRGDRLAWERNLKQALELANEASDDETYVAAAEELAMVAMLGGRGLQRTMLERAQARADRTPGLPGAEQPRLWLAMQLVFADALDEARDILVAVLEETAGRGNLESDSVILVLLADLEVRAGNWRTADEHATRAIALGEEGDLGHESEAAVLYARAAVDAHLGRIESAREAATRGSHLAASASDIIWWAQNERILGLLAISVGDAAGAWEHLGPLTARLRDMRIRAPTAFPVLSCVVEALIGLGRVDEAEGIIDEVQRQGRALGPGWTDAAVSRSRALVAGASGKFGAALQRASDAVDRNRRLPYPFELGRSLLVQGMVQRRAKQRRAARSSLDEAVAIFEELGASLWATKAHAELGRIGGRAPSLGELTTTERRVAELVAEGHTNREVAAALYVSVRAVEANLSRIYEKLGLRSRAQLARRLSNSQDERAS
jgi:DNA-binding CsgD family transcriptional regulator